MFVAVFFAFLKLFWPHILQVKSSLFLQQFFKNFAFVEALLGEFLSLIVQLVAFLVYAVL